jgi:hypothetical protein
MKLKKIILLETFVAIVKKFLNPEFVQTTSAPITQPIIQPITRLIPKYEVYNALKRWSDSRGSVPTMTRFKKTLIEYCKYRDFEFNPELLCTSNDNRIICKRDEGDRKITMECICVHVPGNNIQLD